MKRAALLIAILSALLKYNGCQNDGFTFKNPIRFPWAGGEFVPYMGIFLALALPLDLPDYNVFVSFNLEANYVLPQNQSEFSYPPLVTKRSLDRQYFYEILERKFKSHGYDGKWCLLRAICEAAEHTFMQNGVLGDLVHILLTPSSSKNLELAQKYWQAESYGKSKGHCRKYHKKCPTSLLDMISVLDHFI